MVLKGLLVTISGFAFIFSSGIPMNMISRFRPDYKRDGLYWGMGIWALTFFLSNFLQSFIKQIVTGSQAEAASTGIITYLSGDLITIFLLQLGMLIYLKKRAEKDDDIESDGLALGFGIGLIAHIFTGIIEIGLGAQMLFQQIANNMDPASLTAGTIANVANASFSNLLVTLLSTIMFRVALLTISATQGYLVASSIKRKSSRFWAGILLYICFTWGALLLEVVLGESDYGQILGVTSTLTSALVLVFYAAMTFFSYRWLSKELQSSNRKKQGKRSK